MFTDEFVYRVRQMCQLPDNDQDWGDSDILTEGTLALRERFTQVIANIRQGYWLKEYQIPLVAGTTQYRIPYRFSVQGLELVEVQKANNSGLWRQLQIATTSQTTAYSTPSLYEPSHFEIRGDNLVLYPTPQQDGWMRIRGYLRPSDLVLQQTTPPTEDDPGFSNVGFIESCGLEDDGLGNQLFVITLAEDDFDFTNSVGFGFDVVQTTGCAEVTLPNMFCYTYVAPRTLAFRIDYPGQFAASDTVVTTQDEDSRRAAYLIHADESITIPLPQELHSALVAWTSAVILTERGDLEKAAACAKKAEAAITRAIDVMTPRIKAQPYTFKTRNTYLRRRQAWGWGRW
jgi:hypothetical protein